MTYQTPARWPWLSRSYPFLSIANHFGMPYAEVLRMSDLFEGFAFLQPRSDYDRAIEYAVDRELDRKAGKLGALEEGR